MAASASGHARAILTAPDPRGLAQRAISEGLNVRDVERLAQQAKDEKHGPRVSSGGASADGKSADTRALGAIALQRARPRRDDQRQGRRGGGEDLLQDARAARRRHPPFARRVLAQNPRRIDDLNIAHHAEIGVKPRFVR